MNRACAARAAAEAADLADIHERARAAIADVEALRRALFAKGPEPERVHEHTLRLLRARDPQRDAVEAVNGVLGGDPGCPGPCRAFLGARSAHDLEHETVVILARQHALQVRALATARRSLALHVMAKETFDPERDRRR